MSASGLNVTNFAVQYSNADATEIAASTFDLVILEASPGAVGLADLTNAEVASLTAQGKVISGYISVGQTDDARPWWDPAWTDDGTDTGTPTASAPSWLAEQANSFAAAMVEFWDPAWKALVIGQVEEMATRGYNAVFLDNILTYYELAQVRGELGTAQSQFYAAEMMKFVGEIKAAATAINPDFAVIANGGPYIIGDAGLFGTQAATDYLEAVDGIMAESFFGLINGIREEGVLDVFETFWAANGIDVLALEYSTDQADIDAFVAEAVARGFAPSVSPTQDLNSLPEPLIDPDTNQTGDNGANVMLGGNGVDVFDGLGGNDLIRGYEGDDSAHGGEGNDRIFGGAGLDDLHGDAGNDRIVGGLDADVLSGDDGEDDLVGQSGNDMLYGGNDNDRLIAGGGQDVLLGGLGNDVHVGGTGRDSFVFEDAGNDRITDFELTKDTLLVEAAAAYDVRQVGGGLRFTYDSGASMVVVGLIMDDLAAMTIDTYETGAWG